MVDASSWARSTTRCSRCPESSAPPLRCGRAGPETRSSSATSPSRTGFDAGAAVEHLRAVDAGRTGAATGRGGRRCRPAPRARSTATRSRGRSPTPRSPLSSPPPAGGHRGLGRRALARRRRCGRHRRERRLLRPRRRQPDRGPDGLPAARPLSRGHGRRPLREPDGPALATHARRDERAGAAHQPQGPAHAVEDPDRADRLHGPVAPAVRPALADLGRGREQPGRVGPGPGLPADVLVVVGPGRLDHPGVGARADGAQCRSAHGSCSARSPRATTRAAAGSTCGSGWPSGSPTSSAPPTWPARPGCRRTPGHSARRIGKQVDLHSIPPVTGMLTLGDGCSVEPEVDLCGHWLDGDVLHIGTIKVGAGARVGHPEHAVPRRGRRSQRRGRARLGGHRRGHEGRVLERVPRRAGRSDPRAVVGQRPDHKRGWVLAYAGIATVISLLPIVAVLAGLAVALPWLRDTDSLGEAALVLLALAAVWPRSSGSLVLALLVAAARPAPGDRADGGRLPDPQPPRLAGVGDDEGARRGAHLAVPALLERAHARLAPAARRPGGTSRRGVDGAADPEADQHQRRGVPRRRHPPRQLRARRRLASGGAHQDRQARLRRQLRDDRARAGRCPSSPWSRCSRRHPRKKSAKAGSSWLGSPPVLLRRPTGERSTTAGPIDPPRRLQDRPRTRREPADCSP